MGGANPTSQYFYENQKKVVRSDELSLLPDDKKDRVLSDKECPILVTKCLSDE